MGGGGGETLKFIAPVVYFGKVVGVSVTLCGLCLLSSNVQNHWYGSFTEQGQGDERIRFVLILSMFSARKSFIYTANIFSGVCQGSVIFPFACLTVGTLNHLLLGYRWLCFPTTEPATHSPFKYSNTYLT